jgi:hypothetical protein
MNRTLVSTPVGAAVLLLALVGCGDGGDAGESAATPAAASITTGAPAATAAAVPAATPAPASAAAPAPATSEAPVAATLPGDAVRGKTLWNTQVAGVGLACVDCHGLPSQNVNNVLNGAAGWEVISRTIQTNPSMRPFLGKLSGYDMQDLSAYLRNPLL